MVAPSSAGTRFRQRKISTKQTLQILKQSQISDIDNEDLQQRELQEIETGVDKNEEDEVHLQKILKKTGLTHTADTYIPTPDASKAWTEADRFYKGQFQMPDSYIKSSCQLEDYCGVMYYMDEEDDEYFKKLNAELTKEKKTPITEDEFEVLMYNFEKTINEKQPFLVTDPHQILPLSDIRLALLQVDRSSAENVVELLAEEVGVHPFITKFDAKLPKKPRHLKDLVELCGSKVYDHFSRRKIARGGKSVTPTLKFNGDDDNDAYVCFRQRQFRQQRKTRRADTQSSEKLIKLKNELKATKELTFLVAQREMLRLESLKTEREIFELRCKVKVLKRDLGITDSDEDLITHKKKKPVPPPVPQPVIAEIKDDKRKGLSKSGNNANIDKSKIDTTVSDGPQQFQPYVKLPPSKIPDMDLESVDRVLSTKEYSIQKYVEEKLKKRKLLDNGYINLTDDPYSPFLNVTAPYDGIVDPDHIPYSSLSSSFFDVEAVGYIPKIDNYVEKGVPPHESDVLVFNPETNKFVKKFTPEKYNPFVQTSVHTSDSVMTLRKRVGRLGQTYVDRRGMVKMPTYTRDDFSDDESFDTYERKMDQWKFDRDVDEFGNSQTMSDDPSKLNNISNDTQVIRFGSMLLAKAYDLLKESMIHQRQQLYFQQMQRLQAQQRQHQAQQEQQSGTTTAAVPTSQRNSPAPGVNTAVNAPTVPAVGVSASK